jgi:hypothetical protein
MGGISLCVDVLLGPVSCVAGSPPHPAKMAIADKPSINTKPFIAVRLSKLNTPAAFLKRGWIRF